MSDSGSEFGHRGDEDDFGQPVRRQDPRTKSQIISNQPFDEAHELDDDEDERGDSPPLHGEQSDDHADYGEGGYMNTQSGMEGKRSQGVIAKGGISLGQERDKRNAFLPMATRDEFSGSEDSDGAQGGMQTTGKLSQSRPAGPRPYDPNDYEQLNVSTQIRDLFRYISAYQPQTVEIETTLKPFIPEYIPAIGDIDGFLKITRPDKKMDGLALSVVDEPAAKQSEPSVLELQLRKSYRTLDAKPVQVHSIENAARDPKALTSWIDSMEKMHANKSAPTVSYTKVMPDIEQLMQQWPPEFEDALKNIEFPSADLDVDLETYTRIICSLLDIPVYSSHVESLHVLFSLYSEVKASQGIRTE